MKKKIFSSLLMAAFVFASVGTFVSCKDYDDDISSLSSRIDELSKLIDDLESQITSGSVISDVASTSNGVKITLSNGKSYDITNGTNGTNGTDGKDGADGKDGVAWTIGDDGYWYKDGVKTEYKALGKDGADGKDGVDGKDGSNGTGTDGKTIYYSPNEDGYFHKITLASDGTTASDETTNIQWKASTTGNVITAVLDNDNLKLYGVQGATEDPLVISTSAALRGLVFAGDKMVDSKIDRVYAENGDPAIRIEQFTYTAQEFVKDSKNSKNEKTTAAKTKDKDGKDVDDEVTVTPTTYAYYHVNPSNVKFSDLKNLKYIWKDTKVLSRASATKDFSIKAEAVSLTDGVLKVKLTSAGAPATEKDYTVTALQALKEKSDTVTSDYTAVEKSNIAGLRIADNNRFDQDKDASGNYPADKYWHFRRASVGISAVDKQAGRSTVAAWDEAEDANFTNCDIKLQWDGTPKDLNTIVGVHVADAACSASCAKADLNALGFELSYEVVKNYKVGSNETDQADFIELSGSEIKAKTYTETGKSSVNRTPIIRVTLTDKANNKVVEVAYVKIKIVDEQEIKPVTLSLTPGKGVFTFLCETTKDNDFSLTATVEQFNLGVYNKKSMSQKQFHTKYATFDPQNNEKITYADGKTTVEPYNGGTYDDTKGISNIENNVGYVEAVNDNSGVTTGVITNLVKWTLTPYEMWYYAGQEVTHVVRYKSADGDYVDVELKATVGGIVKSYDPYSADYISEYWNTDKTIANFNVNVPAADNYTASTCLFENDLNSPFVTKDGKLKLGNGVVYEYYFCKDIVGEKTIGSVAVKFQFGADGKGDGTSLYAAKKGSDGKYGTAEEIATITNGNATVPYNTVSLVKTSTLAKELLNTGELVLPYSVSAWACEKGSWKKITVTFNGADHFNALFVQPITISNASSGSFTDGVDFKKPGSYIDIRKLINPSDWRKVSWIESYWTYYGPFKVTVDTKTVECNLNGVRQAIPATIELEQTTNTMYDATGKVAASSSGDGFLTYKNNGTSVQRDFELYVKAKVEYGWGEIYTGWITVKVNKTIAK